MKEEKFFLQKDNSSRKTIVHVMFFFCLLIKKGQDFENKQKIKQSRSIIGLLIISIEL